MMPFHFRSRTNPVRPRNIASETDVSMFWRLFSQILKDFKIGTDFMIALLTLTAYQN